MVVFFLFLFVMCIIFFVVNLIKLVMYRKLVL
jgi:hypothetical protein